MERGRLKTVQGLVVSDSMQKTIVVKSERRVKHPRYNKYVRKVTTYYAHDENDDAQRGDLVELAAMRPMSKTKCWRLLKIVTPAAGREIAEAEGIGQ
jgi:small subunit ribosomal protein S17